MHGVTMICKISWLYNEKKQYWVIHKVKSDRNVCHNSSSIATKKQK